jgi:hypothetical protein
MGSKRDYAINNCEAVERSDGSYIDTYGDIAWYNKAGQYHRVDGPAVIFADGDVRWLLNDKNYSFADWLIKLNKTDETKMMLRLQYG